MRARSLPYAARDALTPDELTSFTARGGRFRSRPGAPMATPPQGLASSGMQGAATPLVQAQADANWGATFRNTRYAPLTPDNSTMGGIPGLDMSQTPTGTPTGLSPTGAPLAAYGTAANPLRLGSAETASLVSRRVASGSSPQPFMLVQNRTPLNLPDMKLPPDATPRQMLEHTVSQLEDWHSKTGTPLPGRDTPGTQAGADEILKKYRTPQTTATYRHRLDALNG